MGNAVKRLALIVSHPIQYFTPLYSRLGRRADVAIKVFFSWHAFDSAVTDRGFGKRLVWDIPLTEGYEFELVPNRSSDPGTHRFFGLRNPTLVERVMAWRPDVVHVTGWAWFSHLKALREFHQRGVRTLFRGDSHLLDSEPIGPRGWIKCTVLREVFSWPAGFLVVGAANRAYYEYFGVEVARLHSCPHSIDVERFAEPAQMLEHEAMRWRAQLGILPGQKVFLFAGKFERKKRPADLMRVVQGLRRPDIVLILVGGGELQAEVDAIAVSDPERFRVLPFQNQSQMPVVYRLGDVFVLPSANCETWGLAVNEALACGRPVVVSDRVGCAADVVDSSCGRIFRWSDWSALGRAIEELIEQEGTFTEMRIAARERANLFDISVTESTLMTALAGICAT
jgi:glycosyltransferase involved in cell wall biosynthesis